MKKIIGVVLIVTFILYGKYVHWMGDYDKALQKAQKEHKPLMVLLVKRDCIKCKKVLYKYFTNNKNVEEINKNYVPVIVTFEQRDSYPSELLYSTCFPTLFILDNQKELFLKEPFCFKEK